jgi:Kazal-type serine protease inhibitor domain
MKKIIAFLTPLSIAVILTAATCKKPNLASDCVEKPANPACNCPEIFKPVCGCNGVTYPNECTARCQNISQFKEGACVK